MHNPVYLFTDVSVNPKSKIGYGAILYTEDVNQSIEELKSQVKLNQFTDTSSTKLELENLLWGLSLVTEKGFSKIIVHTDSQNVLSLLNRRKRLEDNNYQTKGNKQVNHHQLYKAFFEFYDTYHIEIVKIKGHQPGRDKSTLESIFTLVDRASRQALRKGV
ncbi:ribonuclease HI [Plebeiibacterium sediminum]|uniref:Reverse transcriptase-like protein n=1 Tax=Plebeiibacterium sediminum TaxID=2992112 RepID=A0AAE3SFC9_9BACT|nr:RNase H family protein [Plebeiobacterium sediminum]MCW3786947.1 reverse transcriptase-like protein [Plebeiobacterium sediminum]